MQLGLDLRSVDIGCDGNTGDDQQKVSKYTDFPALIERLQNENDLTATETFPCYKERKFADSDDNFELQEADQRIASCRYQCAEEYKSVCQSKSCW